jgi:hypothetical protein
MKARPTREERLRTLLIDARWCLRDDVRAAGPRQVRLQPELHRRARLLARIDRVLAAVSGKRLRRPA